MNSLLESRTNTMLHLNLSVSLTTPAEKVWDVIGNFNGLPDWHPWVSRSFLEPAAAGVGRRVTIDGGKAGPRELTERLVSFDASKFEYAYTIIAGPIPFKNYVGVFKVIPSGRDQCVFEYRGAFEAAQGFTDEAAMERVRSFYEAATKHLPNLFGGQ